MGRLVHLQHKCTTSPILTARLKNMKSGKCKIGQFKWKPRQRRPDIPEKFHRLRKAFFSLGQDVDYYKALMQLPENERNGILKALRDVANDKALYIRALDEEVMTESLMRSAGARKVRDPVTGLC